jgi:hypothetical protein
MNTKHLCVLCILNRAGGEQPRYIKTKCSAVRTKYKGCIIAGTRDDCGYAHI